MRNLLSSEASLIRGLAEDAQLDTLLNSSDIVIEDTLHHVNHHHLLPDDENGILLMF